MRRANRCSQSRAQHGRRIRCLLRDASIGDAEQVVFSSTLRAPLFHSKQLQEANTEGVGRY